MTRVCDVFVRVKILCKSRERMVLSTKSKGWGASLISIVLTLLFTMV